MDSNVIGFIVIQIIITVIMFLILFAILHPRGRKAPTAVINEGIRIYYLAYLKRSKRYYMLNEIEGKEIFYTDWDRGIGYGYMKEPFRLGDQILTPATKGRMHVLIVYRMVQPEGAPEGFFHFKTFYLRTAYVKSYKREAETQPGLGGFQRYD